MKKLSFLFIASMVAITINAQTKLSFEKEVSGTYQKAMIAIAKNFKNAQKVIQYSDKDAGIIVFRSCFDFRIPFSWGANKSVDGTIYYNGTITVKNDSTLHVVLDDFQHTTIRGSNFGTITTEEEAPKSIKASLQTKGWKNKVWNKLKEDSETYAIELFPIFE